MYLANSVLMNIYNVSSGLKINQSVEIQAELENSIELFNTSNGVKFLNLTEGAYTFKFFSEDFENTQYLLTVGNNSFQRLDVYMAEVGEQSTVFTFVDKDTGNIIEGAILSVKRLVGNKWVVINTLKSDVSGKVTFTYKPNTRYQFTVVANNYKTRNFELDPIIFTTYNINLEKQVQPQPPIFQEATAWYSPKVFINNQNNTIEFGFASPEGSFQTYGYNITYKDQFYSWAGFNAYGETNATTFELTNATFGDRIIIEHFFLLSNGETWSVKNIYDVRDSQSEARTFIRVGEDYGLGFFERSLIVTIISILVGGAAFVFGGVVAAGITILLLFGYFIYIGFLSAWLLIPSMILIGVAVAWRATQ
jgi:hypothetical protein